MASSVLYALLKRLPPSRDPDYWDQLRRSARSAPRLIAEGFGRYLPADFSKYLRYANGELKETYDALRDGVDAGYFTEDEILPLQRLSKRASKASTSLIAYLASAKPPNETVQAENAGGAHVRTNAQNERTQRTQEQDPLNPLNPLNPIESVRSQLRPPCT